jgi:hypothetical protein
MADIVGILAYGSLIGDPGSEIEPHITRRIPCNTPFKVEFARASRTRAGGPSLIPYDGGSHVAAQILVVDLQLKEATDRLYRRERHKVGTGICYVPPEIITPNTVIIESTPSFEGIETVLYTRIGANIDGLTAIKLAERAVESARARHDGSDGISYLLNAKRRGIQTPLSPEYEKEILRLTGTDSLEAALNRTRV